MFSLFRRTIAKQTDRIKKEFQEVIRPVVDRAVEDAYTRQLARQQRGGWCE